MPADATSPTTAAGHPIARVLPLLSPAHLDRDFDYLVPPEMDAEAQPGVRVRVRFAGRLVDGYLLERLPHSDHTGKLVPLDRVVSPERVLTPEILRLVNAVAARYAGTRADVLRLAIPPRHARTELGSAPKKSAKSVAPQGVSLEPDVALAAATTTRTASRNAGTPVVQDMSDAATGDLGGPVSSEDSSALHVCATLNAEHGVQREGHAAAHPTPSAYSAMQAFPPESASAAQEAERVARQGDRTVSSSTPPADSATQAVSSDTAWTSLHTEHGAPQADQTVSDEAQQAAAPKTARDLTDPVTVANDAIAGPASSHVTPGVPPLPSPAARSLASAPVVNAGADGATVGLPSSQGDPGDEVGDAQRQSVSDPVVQGGSIAAASESATHGGRGEEDARPADNPIDTTAWQRYRHGDAFLSALADKRGPRAAWQALPGEDWAARLAELAATVVKAGRSAVLLVPDQRDLDRLLTECVALVGDSAVGLSAGLGPAARYRRWLAVLRGQARIVVGTRASVFAPAKDLGLIAIWDDGDDTYAEPRAPYPHAREVAMLRAHETGAAFVAGGFARSAEIQAVVDSGWAHDLVADRQLLRSVTPRISAPGDSDYALERDPIAKAIRIPGVAFAAARAALKENAPVLVQVPRRGYVPALACAKCRTPARCRHCNGPLALPHTSDGTAASPHCRWCGVTDAAFRCSACGGRALRATVIGAQRTAEELGRAFPGVPIRGSGGGEVLDTVDPGASVVVATPGAEPTVPGGYGVALLLDGWALLSRADLRAAEDTLRRWMGAAALVRPRGQVIVMAEPDQPTVQALVRWDPVNHAAAELAARADVGFPPAVRLAAIDGTTASIAELLDAAQLSDRVEVLGPVPLPPTARKPFSSAEEPAEVERMLLRVTRSDGAALARALTAAQAVRSTHRSDAPLRVQIDPVDIG
ncbi:primosomal protein N' [Nocardia camponoti]|uniref:Probable replication restart protein PriA n=1 Tax=Nocardia camponoti TaxID=1616106 RepID=A0A917QAM0_9NOCA|nr:primosomal protein N' [Nocardia camponoti]GGK39342.1 hypothetical protein GCM10011591_08750 [Nocardia camponoti]